MATPFKLVRLAVNDGEKFLYSYGIAIAVDGDIFYRAVKDRGYASYLAELHNARYAERGRQYVYKLIRRERELASMGNHVFVSSEECRISDILASGI